MRKQSTNFKFCKSIVKNAVNKKSETICDDILLVSENKSQVLETIDQVVDDPQNTITNILSHISSDIPTAIFPEIVSTDISSITSHEFFTVFHASVSNVNLTEIDIQETTGLVQEHPVNPIYECMKSKLTPKRSGCQLCARHNDKKVTKCCQFCGQFICKFHSKLFNVCNSCEKECFK